MSYAQDHQDQPGDDQDPPKPKPKPERIGGSYVLRDEDAASGTSHAIANLMDRASLALLRHILVNNHTTEKVPGGTLYKFEVLVTPVEGKS